MSWTNITKNISSFVSQIKSDIFGYFFSNEDNSLILVGGDEDEILVFNEPTVWNNITKN